MSTATIALMPEFETVAEWMQRAAEECDRTGRSESGLLWRDALHYLRAQQAQIERMRFALLSHAEARG